jgi:ubiquinone/menaquinone biosynthesis C-methylase UbiE
LEKVSRHLAFLKHPGELRFKRWMDKNATDILLQVHIKRAQTVLDFGCGSGTYTIPAAKIVGESGLVCGLDIEKAALEKLKKKARLEGLRNVVTIASTGSEAIPLDDETVDHVLLIDVLQNIADRSALFAEVRRVLKPDGLATVFPMHLDKKAVENIVIDKGFTLEQAPRERILVFKRLET